MCTHYRLSIDEKTTQYSIDMFNEILEKIRTESYPNGNAGHEDRKAQLFIDAGFVINAELTRYGTPHVPSRIVFDAQKIEVKTKTGESSGKTLYSVDGNAWYSTESMAIEVYERKQRIIMEKRNERD